MSARMAALLKTVMGVKYGGTMQLQNLLVNLLLKWLRWAKIPHMGGVGGIKRTCKGLFTEFTKQLPELDPDSAVYTGVLRYRKGIIADLMLDAMSLGLSGIVAKTPGGRTLARLLTPYKRKKLLGFHPTQRQAKWTPKKVIRD